MAGRKKQLDISTPIRWWNRPDGLEYLQTPSGRITTEGALLRFFAKLTAMKRGDDPSPRSPRRRQKDLERASKRLEAAGI